MRSLLRAVFFLGVGLVLMLGTGCGSGGSGSDSTFRVLFTMDGTDFLLTGGYTAQNVFDAGANGCVRTGGVRIAAVAEDVNDMSIQGPYVYIFIDDTVPGVYNLAGDGMAGTDDGGFGVSVDGTTNYYSQSATDDFSLTLTSLPGSVGGAIEGSFGGTVKIEGGIDTVEVTNGYFFVERLADGAITTPDFFK